MYVLRGLAGGEFVHRFPVRGPKAYSAQGIVHEEIHLVCLTINHLKLITALNAFFVIFYVNHCVRRASPLLQTCHCDS